MTDEKEFDKENKDRNMSFILKNQMGYTDDIYELLKGSLTGVLLAYETAETCTYDTLDKDITSHMYDLRGQLRVSTNDSRYMRIVKDDIEWREELYTGTKFLVDHVLRTNELAIDTLYSSFNIRDVQIPVITQNSIVVMLSGVKL